MKTFSVTTAIRATPEVIWGLLTDAPNYPAWNETVTKVDGRIAKGEKITVHAKISPNRAFPVEVVEFEPGRRMVWQSRLPLGLFQGVRTYTLTPNADSSTEFSMKEVFSGPLSFLIERTIPDLQPDFNAIAACLKKRAEAGK